MSKRWIQFGSAVLAMIMIANLQYAWTFSSSRCRMHTKTGSYPAIQWAFTLFIFLETWITPVEGWLIDRLGPRIFLSDRWIARWHWLDWDGLCAFPSRSFTFFTGLPEWVRHSSTAAPLPPRSNGFPISAARFPDSSPRGLERARPCSFPRLLPRCWPSSGYQSAFLYTGIGQGIINHSCRSVPAQPRAGF